VADLPAAYIKSDIDSSGSSTLKALLSAQLPRRHQLPQAEVDSSHKLLLALGRAHSSYIIDYIRDGLSMTSWCSDPQRALLLRVLAVLSESKSFIGRDEQNTLWPLLSQLLHGAQVSAHTLSATLACIPYTWVAGNSKEQADLQRIAFFLPVEERELSRAASKCMQQLAALNPPFTAVPVLLAISRMLLGVDGSKTQSVQRALSIGVSIAGAAMDALSNTSQSSQETSPTAADWAQLRITIQAACLMWLQHTHHEIVTLASEMLYRFESSAPPSSKIEGTPILIEALGGSWGVRNASKQPAVGGWAREVEKVLDERFADFFPSISLVWPALWEQAKPGPRAEDAEGMRLWRKQLAFLCRFTRYPMVNYNAAAQDRNLRTSERPATTQGAPTKKVSDGDVHSMLKQMVQWVVNAQPQIGEAVVDVLSYSHRSTVELTVTFLKQAAVTSVDDSKPSRGLSLLTSKPRKEIDALPDVYHQERVLRLLADLYAKVPPTELALDATDQKSSRSDATLNMQRLLGHTLEELCSTWLKDRNSSKATGLTGAPLTHAAFLMRTYFLFVAATLRNSSTTAEKEKEKKESKNLAPAATTIDSIAMLLKGGSGARLQYAKDSFALLKQWMHISLGSIGAATHGNTAKLVPPHLDMLSPILPAMGADLSKAAKGKSCSGGEAVLQALEALIIVRSLSNSDGVGLEQEIRQFLLGLLTSVHLQRPVCNALGTLLAHNPSMISQFMRVAVCGPEDSRTIRLDSVDGSVFSSINSSTRDEEQPNKRHASGNVRGRHKPQPAAIGIEHHTGPSQAPDELLAYAHSYAVVNNCCSNFEMQRGLEPQLLFLSLTQQISPYSGTRELGMILAQALAHSNAISLPADEAHHIPWVGNEVPLLYMAAPFRYSACLAAHHLRFLPPLLEELIDNFSMLTNGDKEGILELLLPWIRQLGRQPPDASPVTPLANRGTLASINSSYYTPPGGGAVQQVLSSLLSLCRLAAQAQHTESLTSAETAHLSFLLQAAWAALVTPYTSGELVPAVVNILLKCHTAASAVVPPDLPEIRLCSRVALMLFRTSCKHQLLAAFLSRLRLYEGHCPPASESEEWLTWRAARLPEAEPLRPEERSVLQLLIQLPQELNTLLVPHLPLLLHTCVVCYGPEAQSVLQGVPNGVRHAQVQATALLRALLRNLAPRAHPLPPTNKQVYQLWSRGHLLPSGLTAIGQLIDLFTEISPSVRGAWRDLALHWALHAVDPDIALTSLRAFAALVEPSPGEWCNPDLIRTLDMSLWGALREGACAKAQLLLRLMRTLPLTTTQTLPPSTWLLLGATAASVLSCRYEALFLEALRLLQALIEKFLLPTDTSEGNAGLHDALGNERATSIAAGSTLVQTQLEQLDAVWRHEVASRGLTRNGHSNETNHRDGSASSGGELPMVGGAQNESTSLDSFLASLLLKGVSIGVEVSEECRNCALRVVESLAVCYADSLPPNNRLAILVLFAHTLGVMLDTPAAAVRAKVFLERCGSALTERLTELFASVALERAKHADSEEADSSMMDRNSRGSRNLREKPESSSKLKKFGRSAQNKPELFVERFFPAFALAFSDRENCAFALRLLRAWLISATDRAEMTSGEVQDATADKKESEAHRCVVAVLRMLHSFLRQFAPSECTPEGFAQLAPAVVRCFHSRASMVAQTAEALLAEMVSRAPRGTPASIFNLLQSNARPGGDARGSDEQATELAEGFGDNELAWDLPLVPTGDVAGQASLAACVERLQLHALQVPIDALSTEAVDWGKLPRAALVDLCGDDAVIEFDVDTDAASSSELAWPGNDYESRLESVATPFEQRMRAASCESGASVPATPPRLRLPEHAEVDERPSSLNEESIMQAACSDAASDDDDETLGVDIDSPSEDTDG